MKEIKDAIIYKWAGMGLTASDIKKIIDNKEIDTFIKSSMDTNDFLFKYIPALSFGVPLVGGSLLYVMTHPQIKDESIRKARKEILKKEFEREGYV